MFLKELGKATKYLSKYNQSLNRRSNMKQKRWPLYRDVRYFCLFYPPKEAYALPIKEIGCQHGLLWARGRGGGRGEELPE
jgi:hypothetical protein